MINVYEEKNATIEIAEMLSNASKEEKILIKGILIGANALKKSTLNDMRKEHGA